MQAVDADPGVGDNPAMTTRRPIIAFLVLAWLLPAAGCGWVEWPPPDRPQMARRTPVTAVPTARPESDAAFIAATAVVVGKGDTVYGLAKRHRVSMRAIIEGNRLAPPYHLRVGQRLVLPRGTEHRVVKGDTLSGIAQRYDVDFYSLARANDLAPPYTIRLGTFLRIPTAPARIQVATAPATAASRPAPVTAAKPPPPVTASPPKPSPPVKTVMAPKRPKKPAAIPKPPPRRKESGFVWPVKGRVIAGFGTQAKGLQNDGINIAAPRGSPVRAAESGVVAYAGNELRGFGNLLLIKHSGGWISAYAHNDELLVKRGGKVRRGQAIARVGSSGNVGKPQLHFELRKGKRAVDPRKHLTGSI